MLCEIVNPSDPYTIEIPDELVGAYVAALFRGQYPMVTADDEQRQVVPFFWLGGFDEWWKERCDVEPAEWFKQGDNAARVATALESITLGREERSSMNDIGGTARKMAAAIRGLPPGALVEGPAGG